MMYETMLRFENEPTFIPFAANNPQDPKASVQTRHFRIFIKEPLGVDLAPEPFLSNEGIVALPSSPETFNYQIKGQETLTAGDARCWIWDKLRFSYLEGYWDPGFVGDRGLSYVLLPESIGIKCLDDVLTWHRLNDAYSIKDTRAVYKFLQAHPNLAGVLLEAHPYIVSFFGPNPHVELELLRHPESDGWQQLFGNIVTSMAVHEGLELLDRLDEEWFLDQQERVGDLLNFDVKFI